MPSITLRQLRDTRRLKAWLCAGQTVELRERDRVLARIVSQLQPRKEWRPGFPDFEARAKRMFGDRQFDIVDWLIRNKRMNGVFNSRWSRAE